MNSCEIKIVNEVKNSGDVKTLVGLLKESNPTFSESELESKINELVSISNNTISTNATEDLQSFFTTSNGKHNLAYNAVKLKVIDKIFEQIFNSDEIADNNRNLNLSLKFLQNRLKSERGYKQGNNKDIIDLFNILRDKDSYLDDESNYDMLADYLIINHLDLVIKAWMKDLISVNPNDGRFSFNPKHDVRVDWNSEEFDLKEPDLNGLLSVLLKNTRIKRYGKGWHVQSESNMRLSNNSLFFAVNDFIKNLTSDEYTSFIDNPYYIFDLLKDKLGKMDVSLEANVLKSFIEKWLFKYDGKDFVPTKFYKYFSTHSDATGFSPIDIFVQSFLKYRTNLYAEVDINGYETIGYGDDEGELVKGIYSVFCSNLDNGLNLDNMSGLFDKSGTRYKVKDNIDHEYLSRKSITIFGVPIKFIKAQISPMKIVLNGIADFINQNTVEKSKDFFRNTKISGNETYYTILSKLFKSIIVDNPNIIKGAIKNRDGKQLPVIGLNSLANDIRTNVLRNDLVSKDLGVTGKRAYQHSFLYDDIKKGKGIFKGTIYTSTLSNGDIIKDATKLSSQEAFKLSFGTYFYKNWVNDQGNIAVQAITVSDKTKIPYYLFDVQKLKSLINESGKSIEDFVGESLQEIHGSYLLNIINDIATIISPDKVVGDWNNIDLNNKEKLSFLLERYQELDEELGKYTIDELNDKINSYNKENGTNILISLHNDYIINKSGRLTTSKYLINSIKEWIDYKNLFRTNFSNDIELLQKDMSSFNVGDKEFVLNELTNPDDSILYEYFLVQALCSDNILINTVGLPYSHKTSDSNFRKQDTKAHVTMVKRMVAMTATGHAMKRGNLNGMPNVIKTMSWYNKKQEMFTMSGKSTGGESSLDKLEESDGVMVSTFISDTLAKQSISDVKPDGNCIKYLIHSFRPDKSSASLVKMASNSIDNKFLRCFSNNNATSRNTNITDPIGFIKCQLEGTSIHLGNIDKEGYIVDYDGNRIFDEYYTFTFKKDGRTLLTTNLRYNINSGLFEAELYDYNTDESLGIVTANNDLYSLWYNIFGAQWSCENGNDFDESSNLNIIELLNRVGNKVSRSNFDSQSNIDQYLKKNIIMFFPSDSANKSLKPLTTNIDSAVSNSDKRYYTRYNIENFMIQLNPDHEATDSDVSEITQMISYLAANGLAPEYTEKIYQVLKDTIDLLGKQTFINVSDLYLPEVKAKYREQLDKIFGSKIVRIFKDPDLDVISLSNELCREIDRLNKSSEFKISVPYSDHSIMMKLHTTIGSEFNSYIRRKWTGRPDTLMASSNLACIFEDEDGNTHMLNDSKYIYDSSTDDYVAIPINDYLSSLIKDENSNLIQDAYKYEVSPSELEPWQTYYVIKDDKYEAVTIDSHSKLLKLSGSGLRFIKALDIPRNLKTKNITISNGINKINIWHFDTNINMINLGKEKVDKDLVKVLAKKYLDSSSPVLSRILSETYDKDDILSIKKSATIYFQDKVLPALHRLKIGEYSDDVQRAIDITVINNEVNSYFSDFINDENIDQFKYVVKHDERLTTNYYSNKYGIKDMNFSEIKQKKADYFYKNLKSKFPIINSEDPVFYTASGKITIIRTSGKPVESDWLEVTPKIDVNGFRINDEGDVKYKFPENAKLYSRIVNNRKEELLVTDISGMMEAISKGFALYSYTENLELKNVRYISDETALMDLANRQYKTWLKSNIAVSSRIPAQALAFGMVMDTVGYLPWDNNVSMVPNMHVFLEGSDYDIDKIFVIMLGIDDSGLDINTTFYNFIESDNPLSDNQDFVSTDFNNSLIDYIINTNPEDYRVADITIAHGGQEIPIIDYVMDNLQYGDIVLSKPEFYSKLNLQIQEIDEGKSINVVKVNNRAIKNLLGEIKREIYNQQSIINFSKGIKTSMQNHILESIIDLYDDPRTTILATTPTTMAPINDVVEAKGWEPENRNHNSMITNQKVNQTTSVGKVGVGVSANGEKVAYAFEHYNNTLYRENTSLFNVFNINSFTRLIPSGIRVNQATMNDIINYLNSNKVTGHEVLDGKLYYEGRLINVGDILYTTIPSELISSIISSCTDNAKEMKMDLINGTPEILPAYIYLILNGMTIEEATRLLKNDLVVNIINKSRGDIFNGEKNLRASTAIDMMLKDSEYEDKKLELTRLKKIFRGGDWITNISAILSINTGIEVTFGSAYIYQKKVNEILNKALDMNSFDIEKYVDSSDDSYYIEKLDSKKGPYAEFNIFKVLQKLPHYRSMLRVPIQFNNALKSLIKDYDNVVNIADKAFKDKYKIDDVALRKIASMVNDKKIAIFLNGLDFEWNDIVDGVEIVRNISNVNDLITFKGYIESEIITKLLDLYSDNMFVMSLIKDEESGGLFKTPYLIYRLAINVNDPNNTDTILMLKDSFYQIQNEIINGHRVYDWLYLYDLIVNKHRIANSSMSSIFDYDIKLYDSSSIVRKWNDFVESYDKSDVLMDSISEYIDLGLVKDKEDININEDVPNIYGRSLIGYPDPNKLPLFIKMTELESNYILTSKEIARARETGKLIIKTC